MDTWCANPGPNCIEDADTEARIELLASAADAVGKENADVESGTEPLYRLSVRKLRV
jgi:hypothetical protein